MVDYIQLYPTEELNGDWEDNGTMPANIESLAEQVVGHRIVKAGKEQVTYTYDNTFRGPTDYTYEAFVITLDNGKQVCLGDNEDCCAYTALEGFWLDPAAVDHMVMGVGTTDGYTTWHIYADFGDIMRLKVGWSCGNPFYYGYGFSIRVQDHVLETTGSVVDKALGELNQ